MRGPVALPAPGQVLAGRFVLGQVLGGGASGMVHSAFDERLGLKVATAFTPPSPGRMWGVTSRGTGCGSSGFSPESESGGRSPRSDRRVTRPDQGASSAKYSWLSAFITALEGLVLARFLAPLSPYT